ncbi:MAG TPA: NADH-dependent [FeFe] hydrogenase, group A6 [Caldisericia bacterium]|nr:NADH-dependent [FeFe] hydrogenase, group A6 [Caldisericia bacterium]
MNDQTVNITINGKPFSVAAHSTILEACEKAHIHVPTLCYLKEICEEGSCGICVVEVAKARTLQRACITEVFEGMEIKTHTPRVLEARKTVAELILANHPKDCLSCDANESCDLRQLTYDLGISEVHFEKTRENDFELDLTSPSFKRDMNKCILCKRCVEVCEKVQSVSVIDTAGRGMKNRIATFMDRGIGESYCINCGQCVLVCPTGALIEQSEVDLVWKALADPKKIILVETAPAVRVAIGEEFGLPAGSLVTKQMVAGLRRLGFTKVFDTNFSADLTIMEEGYELIGRIKKALGQDKGEYHGPTNLPMITSCSPGWIKFAEHFFPGVLDHLSTCKSPQQMFGAVAKTYYAEKLKVDPRDIVVVSIMPCVAKKYEAKRPEMNSAFHYWKNKLHLTDDQSFQDVDHVLTTREAARMMKQAGIFLPDLPNEEFDQPLGSSTGAAVIFGSSGGVMEAAIRTAYEVITESPLPKLDFEEVRGLQGIKSATIDIQGLGLKIAVANGLGNARVLLEQVAKGESPYHFIEVMACPGGCIGGGGQPYPTNTEVREKRMKAIYCEDCNLPIRKSHENPSITDIYKDFLGQPNGEKSHHLLHTSYTQRDIYEQEKER